MLESGLGVQIYAVIHVGETIYFVVVASALLHSQDWDMLKQEETESGETEAHKAGHVKFPNEGGKKGRAAVPASC